MKLLRRQAHATNIDYVITVRGWQLGQWHITALALTSVTFTCYLQVAQTPVVASITPSGATFDITSITKNSVEYISTGAIDAGTYTGSVVGTGNYEGTLSADWTITTKELTATWGTTSFTYNGSTQNHQQQLMELKVEML